MFKEEIKQYEQRCELFLNRIFGDRASDFRAIHAEYANTIDSVPYEKRLQLSYKPIKEGMDWGSEWESAWFHLTCERPAEWGNDEMAIVLNLSGESMIFDRHGIPFYAVSGNSVFNTSYFKDLVFIHDWMFVDNKLDLWVEAAANSLFGVNKNSDPYREEFDLRGKFAARALDMRLIRFNRTAWSLRFDFEVLWELYKQLPPDSYRRKQLLKKLNDAINAYGDDPVNAAAARNCLAPELQRKACDSALSVSAVGHAHIDVAWLWPVRESVRKAARTFASQLEMIGQYPGFIFGASQAQLYAFVRDHYPELFNRIKQAVKDGSWELQGGMWVEADCNISSGESLVRQFLHGKNFFMDEFGVEVKNLWLPDVFGYSAALPQIIRGSGCDYFLTQKLSWNQYNNFPHHTFIWRGIDGSDVLTHFPPENNYNAFVTPSELVPAQNRFAEGDILPEFCSLFGLGDGGGGVSENHLERAKRLADLEGVPQVKFAKAADFFRRTDKYRDKLAKWDGELYLEMHRGTLTTQALTKRNNRRLEQLFCALEFICCTVDISQYPAAELDYMWKKLLLNQFHDIIPGSSINEVYQVTQKEHAECLQKCGELICIFAGKMSEADVNSLMSVNTLSDGCAELLLLPPEYGERKIVDAAGVECVKQRDGENIYIMPELPGSSVVNLAVNGKSQPCEVMTKREKVLENSLVRYEFAADGTLARAWDKEFDRELLVNECGNVFTMYVDRPSNYEAWDVEVFYRDERQEGAKLLNISPVSCGAVFSKIELEFAIGVSRISQQVILRENSKRLDFVTNVSWHETRRMLRVSFGAAIDTREASYEIQYGYVKRPLHENTSWDKAKFEVPHQRYVDMSEFNYGVALLNDCKYGCRARDGKIDLCLLRSPLYPDPLADRGEHEFTFSYLPHGGNLVNSPVWRESAALNRRPLIFAGKRGVAQPPFRIDGGNVSLEVIKKAEKSDKIVLRLCERSGGQSKCRLHTALPIKFLTETNLIEWSSGEKIAITDNSAEITLKPFEIKTFITIE